MIANIKILEKYCKDYKNIENYAEAVKSPLKYDLHHRREISENKSRKQLIAENLYYGRPPEELIFLDHKEHVRLHKEGKPSPWLGKHCSGETKRKISAALKGEKSYMYGKPKSDETRRKISESRKGQLKGLHWHLENGHRIWTD